MFALELPDEVLYKFLVLRALLDFLLALVSFMKAVDVLDEEEETEKVERRLENHLPVAVVHPDLYKVDNYI